MARPPADIAVLISGSGSNLQALLDAIDDDPDFGGRVVLVASDQPGVGGLDRAAAAGIATCVVAMDGHRDRATWEQALADEVAARGASVIVLAGFMRLLGPAFLDRWSGNIVNVHPSLLPAFPGAHAVRDALLHGAKVTGATVHLIDAEVDHGPIIAQRALDIDEHDTAASLHERIKELEHELLPAAVKLLCQGRLRVDGRVVHTLPADDAAQLTPLDFEHVEHAEFAEPAEDEA